MNVVMVYCLDSGFRELMESCKLFMWDLFNGYVCSLIEVDVWGMVGILMVKFELLKWVWVVVGNDLL